MGRGREGKLRRGGEPRRVNCAWLHMPRNTGSPPKGLHLEGIQARLEGKGLERGKAREGGWLRNCCLDQMNTGGGLGRGGLGMGSGDI